AGRLGMFGKDGRQSSVETGKELPEPFGVIRIPELTFIDDFQSLKVRSELSEEPDHRDVRCRSRKLGLAIVLGEEIVTEDELQRLGFRVRMHHDPPDTSAVD